MDKARRAASPATEVRGRPRDDDASMGPPCEKLREAVRQRLRAEEMFLQALERVADELPDADPKLFAAVGRRLPRLAAALDRDLILEFLLEQNLEAQHSRLRRQIHRLTLEEKADCSAVLELAEAMEPVLAGERISNVGALGYLLRGVLENRRRHLVWADEVIGQELPPLDKESKPLKRALAENATIASELQLLFSVR